MSLVELIARADARGLAASGLACVERCLPLLGGDDALLRPLWATLSDGVDEDTARHAWAEELERVRDGLAGAGAGAGAGGADGGGAGGAGDLEDALAGAGDPGGVGDADDAVALVRRMLDAAPAERTEAGLREWAGVCSAASLGVHRLLDPGQGAGTQDALPLVDAELRRQTAVLELLAGHGAAGLRGALEVATEGRRVLRAVLSRRDRTRA
ncbi:hypothetical protein [Streptomyces sp. SHP 1-2]|uniref:hypothetical protein n=1 Tax=Streptomyces sp. SHP 1-2 TaxID=2769489 RepID=UPI002237A8E3|nr:hypothetical protein [Streptomyces sp. SHP 1-2]MCW5251620.1 hypothetical protein [Streptomyces sp. SHP 1-2]